MKFENFEEIISNLLNELAWQERRNKETAYKVKNDSFYDEGSRKYEVGYYAGKAEMADYLIKYIEKIAQDTQGFTRLVD